MSPAAAPDTPGAGGAGAGGEARLAGGTANRGLVVRVGDTVRRPQGPGQPAVHALLRHLEAVGFDGAPRLLGVDAQGREVLSYVPGSVPLRPYPSWALSRDALASVADLLRRLHEATAGFDAAGHTWRRALPQRFRGPVVTHNDPAPDNVVFRDGRAVALLDFDLAAPGSPAWDLAAAARTWVPLRPEDDVDDERRGQALARFRQLLDAYGLGPAGRELVVDALLAERDWMYDLVREQASAGSPGFADYWTRPEAARSDRARRWCAEHEAELREAARVSP